MDKYTAEYIEYVKILDKTLKISFLLEQTGKIQIYIYVGL